MEEVKANIPAAICLVALAYCEWVLYRGRHISILLEDKVVITVHGPDGTVIEPVGLAPAATLH